MAKTHFFLFFCALSLVVTQSRPHVEQSDVLEDVHVNANSYTTLPVDYYSDGQYSLSTTGVITYAKLIQCNHSRAGLPYIMIDIILPDNANFTNNQAFAVLEISKCATEWSSSCIVATNYLYDSDDILQGHNTVIIPYDNNASTLYLRMKAEIAPTSISIHVSYVDDSYKPFYGEFVSTVFANVLEGSLWKSLFQLAKTNEVNSVKSGKSLFYYINFCEAAISGDYAITVTVTGLPSTPLAGFDLAECSASNVKFANCQVYNGNLNGIVATQLAASTTSVELNSVAVSLSNGIYVNVFGYGGEIDGSNDFILSVIESAYS